MAEAAGVYSKTWRVFVIDFGDGVVWNLSAGFGSSSFRDQARRFWGIYQACSLHRLKRSPGCCMLALAFAAWSLHADEPLKSENRRNRRPARRTERRANYGAGFHLLGYRM